MNTILNNNTIWGSEAGKMNQNFEELSSLLTILTQQVNNSVASLQNDVGYLQSNINYQISQVRISLNQVQEILNSKIDTEVNTLSSIITDLTISTNTITEGLQNNIDAESAALKILIDENLEKINSSLLRIINLETLTDTILPIAEDLRNQTVAAKDETILLNTYVQQARNDAVNASDSIGNSVAIALQAETNSQASAALSNNYSQQAKIYRDEARQIADGVFGIGSGAKYSNTHAGTLNDLSLDNDYLYICVQTGTAGNAIWKKTLLFQS